MLDKASEVFDSMIVSRTVLQNSLCHWTGISFDEQKCARFPLKIKLK